MRMIDLGSQRGPLHTHTHRQRNVMDTPTSVDCGREVRFRRSFRFLMECVVPACCGFQPSSSSTDFQHSGGDAAADHESPSGASTSSTHHASIVTGTFFGYRKGRVSFCLQDYYGSRSRSSSSSSSPLLLLEFAVPTAFLAREMQHGLLRIALVECVQYPRHKISSDQANYFHPYSSSSSSSNSNNSNSNRCSSSSSLFNVPVWSMYCNGRKVGFAIRRQLTVGDLAVLKLMQSVSVGAGVLPEDNDGGHDHDDLIMYLRASFQRVIGSADSESFHMINPVGSSEGQELSIFLLRS